jgi:hypothetical protein
MEERCAIQELTGLEITAFYYDTKAIADAIAA